MTGNRQYRSMVTVYTVQITIADSYRLAKYNQRG